MIHCARGCGREAPIDPDELIGDKEGDPSLLIVTAAPDGWIADPDGDGLVCGDCATPQEIAQWMADLEEADRLMNENDE